MTGPLRILSLGAGVQSTTVALMAAEGEIPPVDAAVFSDTGWEPDEVYTHLAALEVHLADNGVPVHRVTIGNIRADALDASHRFASMPLFVRLPDGRRGMIRRQCTSEYKLKPILSKVRELAGVAPRARPKGLLVSQLIGISLDEIERMRSPAFPWIENVYPLVDLRMTRHDCRIWLRARGWNAPRSACIGCPFHSDDEWRRMRDRDPKAWADAVDFDRAIRGGGAQASAAGSKLLGSAYLHSSLVPLDEVDLSTPEDRGQTALFVSTDWGGEEPAECGIACGSDGIPEGFELLDLEDDDR